MQVSNLYFEIRNHFEGLKLTAYQDDKGIWTIGYGTTHYPDGTAVCEGDTCTEEEAILYAHNDTLRVQDDISTHFPGATQPQFDASVDLAYNIGDAAYDASTVLKEEIANAGDIHGAFLMWNKEHKNGAMVVSPGLTRRRMAEAYLYLNGVNSPDFCTAELKEWESSQS